MGAIIGEIILIALCAAVVIGVIVTAVIRKSRARVPAAAIAVVAAVAPHAKTCIKKKKSNVYALAYENCESVIFLKKFKV